MVYQLFAQPIQPGTKMGDPLYNCAYFSRAMKFRTTILEAIHNNTTCYAVINTFAYCKDTCKYQEYI